MKPVDLQRCCFWPPGMTCGPSSPRVRRRTARLGASPAAPRSLAARRCTSSCAGLVRPDVRVFESSLAMAHPGTEGSCQAGKPFQVPGYRSSAHRQSRTFRVGLVPHCGTATDPPRLVVSTSCRACGCHNGIMETNATGDVRVWAKSQGLQVGDRGRLPAAVIEAYQAAVDVDAAKPVRRPAREASASAKNGSAMAVDVTSASVRAPDPAGRASRDTTDRPKRVASAAKQPSLAGVVYRIAELEAQVAALTERLDAYVTGAKPSKGFSLPRLR